MRAAGPDRGFVLVEAAGAAAVVVVVACVLCVMAERQRNLASLGESLNNLHRFGAWTGSYAADHEERFWGFTWKAGESNSEYPDLNGAETDVQAASDQAVDIIRRAGYEEMPRHVGWLPHIRYSALPLVEYAGAERPFLGAVSPEDPNRLRWARDPEGICEEAPYPVAHCLDQRSIVKYAFNASYIVPPAFYSEPSGPSAIFQAGSHNAYWVPDGGPLGPRNVGEVAFPADKVHMFDSHARHFGPRQAYFGLDEARLPVLGVDGSAHLRATADAGDGWRPEDPTSDEPTTFVYRPAPAPADWEPRPVSGGDFDTVLGHFMYTRKALAGRDFGGPEIDSR